MHPEFEQIVEKLENAAAPEDIFGDLIGASGEMLARLRTIYRQLARVTHPDGYQGSALQPVAQGAFARLGNWLALAEEKIRAGSYGHQSLAVFLRSKAREYSVASACQVDDLYQRHLCSYQEHGRTREAELRITRDPHNNDLAQNEVQALRLLAPNDQPHKFSSYFPCLIDSFLLQEGGVQRQANICTRSAGWYTLTEAREDYPQGIDAKDMAWIWRRLLVALGFAHARGVVHGAVLPGNVAILPADHGLRLDHWAFSARLEDNSCVSGIEAAYYDWYPEEILNKEIPTPGTDIYLAARSMIFLLGGDPIQHTYPTSVPRPIQAFLKGCTLSAQRARPQDAWALKEEFDELLERMWGERKFHPFMMKTQPH